MVQACRVCKKMFSNIGNLNRHVGAAHPGYLEGSYEVEDSSVEEESEMEDEEESKTSDVDSDEEIFKR